MSKRIAILSGKGGTGKTSVAVNLSVLLSEMSPSGVSNISLIDLDVEEPNALLFFNQSQRINNSEVSRLVPVWQQTNCSLCNKCSKVCEFNAIASLGSQILIFPDLCHSCHACAVLCEHDAILMQERRMGQHSEYDTEFNNLTFDEYKLDIGQPSGVPLIASAMDNLKNEDDNTLVIFDAPPGTACPMVEVVKNSDYVLLVTEPTPFGLHDLQLAVQTVKQMNVEMGILINKSGSGNDNIITDFCKSEDLPILGRIPQSQLIAEAYSRGELVYFLNDEIKSAWQNFANSLLQKIK